MATMHHDGHVLNVEQPIRYMMPGDEGYNPNSSWRQLIADGDTVYTLDGVRITKEEAERIWSEWRS